MDKQLIEILTRLVDLKEYKDKYGKDEHYLQEQPLLWEKAKTLLKACEGKADSTSEKDLRVCEVIASASFIVQKGVDAMYDELIDKHLNVLRQQPFTSSVQHFVETGKVSGTFLLQLRKLLKEHDEICQAAK